MWHFFSSDCLDTFAPLHSVVCKQSHHPTPWLTPALWDTICRKAHGKRKAMNDSNITVYKQLNNKLKHLVSYHILRSLFLNRRRIFILLVSCGEVSMMSLSGMKFPWTLWMDFLEVLELLMIIIYNWSSDNVNFQFSMISLLFMLCYQL